jgi:hypothetical protein
MQRPVHGGRLGLSANHTIATYHWCKPLARIEYKAICLDAKLSVIMSDTITSQLLAAFRRSAAKKLAQPPSFLYLVAPKTNVTDK